MNSRNPLKMSRRNLVITAATATAGLSIARILGPVPSEAAGSIATVYQDRYQGVKAPAKSFDLSQLVQDFAKDAFLGWHYHDFPVFALIVAGEATLMREGASIGYRAGQGAQCGPGLHTMGNRLGTTMRRVVTLLIPPDAPAAVAGTGSFKPTKGPKNVQPGSRGTVAEARSEFDFGQALVDFSSGARSAPYTAPGYSLWTIVQGELAVELEGESANYAAGKFVLLEPGQKLTVANTGSSAAQVAMSMLLPPGTPVATPVLAASRVSITPPSTGDGGLR